MLKGRNVGPRAPLESSEEPTKAYGICRAQVMLAAVQSPLLTDKKHASLLIPRLCNTILTAPSSCRHVSARLLVGQ